MPNMPLRGWLGVTLGAALLASFSAGCDVSGTALFQQPSGGSGSSGGGGNGGSGGRATSGPGGPCATDRECTDQVCSPAGRCVECYEDANCLVNQYCEDEHCIASGGELGGTSSGGSAGSAGNAGGGTTGSSACGGAQVLFVIQRSGIMFEEPDEDANYWGMVESALTGPEGALAPYWDRLDTGALFFVRVQDDDTCPVLSSAAPQPGAMQPLSELFADNASAYQELADADAKMDAPVPEAVAAAAALLGGTARHLVLITTGVSDTCDDTDNPCLMDHAIGAVQEAQKLGVTTHVIGLGDSGLLDTSSDGDGYQTYLGQLANAGAGKPVKKSSAFDEKCSDDGAKAEYAGGNGDAHAYRAESSDDVKQALAEILNDICP
jgi:hypothetical protein